MPENVKSITKAVLEEALIEASCDGFNLGVETMRKALVAAIEGVGAKRPEYRFSAGDVSRIN